MNFLCACNENDLFSCGPGCWLFTIRRWMLGGKSVSILSISGNFLCRTLFKHFWGWLRLLLGLVPDCCLNLHREGLAVFHGTSDFWTFSDADELYLVAYFVLRTVESSFVARVPGPSEHQSLGFSPFCHGACPLYTQRQVQCSLLHYKRNSCHLLKRDFP